MKKVVFIALILIIKVFPQYESSFVTTPFGIAGGFFAGVSMTNTDDINLMLEKFSYPKVEKNIFITGGGGFMYMPFWSGFRIGGMGFSGSTTSKIDAEGKEIIYSIGGGGVTFDYTLPFSTDILISVGTTIGAGSIDLEIYRNRNSFNWTDPDIDNTNDNLSRKISSSYLMLIPALNIDIQIVRFFDLKFTASYHFALLDSWSVDNNKELINPPKNPASGLMLSGGIYFGLFF